MFVYEVPADATEDLTKKIADLISQQRTRSEDDGSYQKVLNGISLAIQKDSNSGVIIAEEAGEILGVAFYNIGISLPLGGPYLWLNELFVRENARNKGIARKILLHLIHWAEREGIKSIELETGINNSVTKHLYNSLDFHDIVSQRYRFNF
ncbi:GNAT family N-acetyltransferase [Fictibacillus sp. WQ 8-8]|uniref:GNAT family N-acetyltransferase n=1 Tax=unclassified Fictibacillus TaxID=2644029 RepID=UPI0006A7AB0D|nr:MULTISPECIES: GNAT family N-acetyltransferase [unclassified Fictibacillus]MCQ6265501.1 GNAT family N-acetyltransferase [Fictibacillus sp. WQ 8-8]MED2973599.1 GNAT family N-acetyltransferase [Fictibacillus sp. B-59209]UZJ77418.1 GNAT family N-acetyltransferase [Fictibacillus sp. KU28468]SFE06529.1 Acetyltransferase (GNAT) family protein [Bacillus sp. OV194]